MKTRDLPASGTIKQSQVKAEFGKGNNLLDYLGEGGVTSSPPLKLTDFYGTSAGTSKEDFENWLDSIGVNGNVSGTDQIGDGARNQVKTIYPLSETGDNTGWELESTPYQYANNGAGSPQQFVLGYVGYVSHFNRIVQHAVESEAEFRALISEGRKCAIEYSYRGACQGRYLERPDRNGYYGVYMSNSTEVYVNEVVWVYWQTSDNKCWKRQYNNPRIEITDLTREAAEIKERIAEAEAQHLLDGVVYETPSDEYRQEREAMMLAALNE